MAKQKRTPPAQGSASDSELPRSAEGVAAEATNGDTNDEVADVGTVASQGESHIAGEVDQATEEAEEDAESTDATAGSALAADFPPAGATLAALVLSDNHLGKVGQVIQVDAVHAEALRLGGLIDTHPNAIKAATPEE